MRPDMYNLPVHQQQVNNLIWKLSLKMIRKVFNIWVLKDPNLMLFSNTLKSELLKYSFRQNKYLKIKLWCLMLLWVLVCKMRILKMMRISMVRRVVEVEVILMKMTVLVVSRANTTVKWLTRRIKRMRKSDKDW